jgi:hypothetical protein
VVMQGGNQIKALLLVTKHKHLMICGKTIQLFRRR